VTDWRELLFEAVDRVQRVAKKSAVERERGRVVGIGASGDSTLVVDRDAEREILESLSGVPRLRVISEEKGDSGGRDTEYTAIVDPIDGSSNFGRAIPFYCVSIGITKGRQLSDAAYAIVRNLVNGDTYYAERGIGSSKNGKPIRTSSETNIGDAVVGIDISRAEERTIRDLAPLVSRVKRQVHFGANALELCLMAEGKTDAFVDTRGKMRIVDTAAAYLISKEAGAVFSEPSGSVLQPALELGERFGFVASANATIHGEILALLRRERPSVRRS
jgi:myo-inositol-1(or 4)-monophosphatase